MDTRELWRCCCLCVAVGMMVVLALPLLGCGDDAGGGDDGGSGNTNQNGMTIEEFAYEERQNDRSWCHYLDDCCTPADRLADTFLPPFCQDGTADPQPRIDTLYDRIASGSINWNGTNAYACLYAMREGIPGYPATCQGTRAVGFPDNYRGLPHPMQIPACKQTIVGQRGLGEECIDHLDCAEGTSCQNTGSQACLPQSDIGGQCASNVDCVMGLVCVYGTCGGLGAHGAPCEVHEDCEEDFICGEADTCTRPINEQWSQCTTSANECGLYWTCNTTENHCDAWGEVGASCTTDFDCRGRCEAGLCVEICEGNWY